MKKSKFKNSTIKIIIKKRIMRNNLKCRRRFVQIENNGSKTCRFLLWG